MGILRMPPAVVLRHPDERVVEASAGAWECGRQGDWDEAESDTASVRRRFGFSVNTPRHWEHGTRQPEGSTRAYLLIINRAPDVVQ